MVKKEYITGLTFANTFFNCSLTFYNPMILNASVPAVSPACCPSPGLGGSPETDCCQPAPVACDPSTGCCPPSQNLVYTVAFDAQQRRRVIAS